MLSVPGKNGLDSVLQRLQELYPESDSPLLVHRLDMDTSGLLLAAKDKNIHQCLQALFETRQIRKRYTALLQGNPRQDEGTIDLPLCPDFSDRPRQQDNWELGKKAVTRFRVEERSDGTTTHRTDSSVTRARRPSRRTGQSDSGRSIVWKSGRPPLPACRRTGIHPPRYGRNHPPLQGGSFLTGDKQTGA